MGIFNRETMRGDIFGGITAGVVALPLALAFGEASGAGPIAGLWGAIIVGFFAALFGGTKTQVSGPTGPMVVVFAGLFASLSGDPRLVFTAVILAGLFQILFGFLKFGQYIRLVPYPVISGFMSGIGCIIIALQVSRLFGYKPEGKSTISALKAIPDAVMHMNLTAAALAALTLLIVFLWPKNARVGQYIPSALAALVIGTLASLFFPGAPVLGDIPTGLPELIMPSFSKDTAFMVVEAALILAVLGAIDSLLTSLVADNMTRSRHDSDKELIGQGVGNTIAGFFGGIPGAGATMRTVINIRSGGTGKLSGMTHSLLLLAVVLLLAPFAQQIPHAVLAGILVKVGFDIVDWQYLRNAHRGPRWDLALMVLVLSLTVFVDLITAVIVGVVLAALAFVKQLADEQLATIGQESTHSITKAETKLLKTVEGKITIFDFDGPLSFGAAADAGHHFRERNQEHSAALILDFGRVPFMDVSAARAVETITCDAKKSGKTVYICGMKPKVAKILRGLEADCCMLPKFKFEKRIDAVRAAVKEVTDAAKNTG
ncbi:MAG: SulP family inorganic anion transporter [Pseudomonadota bacterium]|nr:SulP family inorganic anion transporter [Pseudomonadota bacterium]QKK05549.1 MAG: SulP family inorganic anion transporter [Pseudomonadota bacterium]